MNFLWSARKFCGSWYLPASGVGCEGQRAVLPVSWVVEGKKRTLWLAPSLWHFRGVKQVKLARNDFIIGKSVSRRTMLSLHWVKTQKAVGAFCSMLWPCWKMHLMEAADGITAAKIYCWLSWNKPNFVSHWTKSQGWSCEGANIGKTQRWFCEEANIYRSCEGACEQKCDIMIHYQGTTKYLTA